MTNTFCFVVTLLIITSFVNESYSLNSTNSSSSSSSSSSFSSFSSSNILTTTLTTTTTTTASIASLLSAKNINLGRLNNTNDSLNQNISSTFEVLSDWVRFANCFRKKIPYFKAFNREFRCAGQEMINTYKKLVSCKNCEEYV